MKDVVNTPGKWMHYCELVKSELGRNLTQPEAKELLTKYLARVEWTQALKEVFNK